MQRQANDRLNTDIIQELTAWRRDIHQHPELAFEEHRTADFVAKKLEDFGIEVHRGLAKTGVVGTLRAGTSKRTIGLRADLDALPLQEENTFAHKSKIDGKMHACGHDGHTIMLLGAARELAQSKAFDGTIYFIFQPAEENEGGGDVMIKEGLFDLFPADQVYGMHNMPGIPAGTFAMRKGPTMAAFDRFRITVKGVGAHGAKPDQGKDPVVIGAQIVMGLQTIVSRNVNPLDQAVISTTMFNGGHALNVIPEEVKLAGGVRTFKAKVQDMIERRMEEVVAGICAAHGAGYEFQYQRGYPATVNDDTAMENAAAAAAMVVGSDNVNTDVTPVMGSEDFAFMLQQKPGAYIFIGNGDGEDACMIHNPHYDFNDGILETGVRYWVTLAEQQLAQTQ
jgi:hippurate hydrolase